MIPYFEQPVFDLGLVTIHGFGIAVASALILAQYLTEWRAPKQGLSAQVIQNMVWYSIIFGFIGAHLYSVLAYFPERLLREPLLLFKVWDGISSFGGIVAGNIGVYVYMRTKMPGVSAFDKWRYLDIMSFVFPFGWVLGRLGCSMAHDHPGLVTTFPLAVSLATEKARDFITDIYYASGQLADLPSQEVLSKMGFHDLGIYELFYTLLVIVPLFLFWDRKPRPTGFYFIAFILLYTPVRFLFDFLRLVDVRYFGLTAGQYAAIAVFIATLVFAYKRADWVGDAKR